jgi:hypothetical protein
VFGMKVVRTVLLALLFSLLVGFAIGTVLRQRMEAPTIYLGSSWLGGSAEPRPLDVGHAGAVVLHARHDEEQIG